jgi:myo-inositol-1(or 4)-monophosphatase
MSLKLPPKIVPTCLKLVEEVGKLLLKYQGKARELNVTSKAAQGVVSTADYEAEEKILKTLTKQYPNITFLAEESVYLAYGTDKTSYQDYLKQDWLWIIDPLDGTNNFLNGLPNFAISLALCHKGWPVFGVIHHPSTGESLYAVKDEKTRQLKPNSSRAKTIWSDKNEKKLKECLLATGFVTEKGEPNAQEFEVFKTMMSRSRGIRRMGSASLDLCYVATGQFDGFWERGLPPWDLAAAAIICQNSGVSLSNLKGRPYKLGDPGIIAARDPLLKELVKALSPLKPV